MHPDACDLIKHLRLSPHPEGGFYRRTFTSQHHVASATGLDRYSSTSIYYLLPGRTFSAFHRIASDEFWHVLDGDSAFLHCIDSDGTHQSHALGRQVNQSEQPQIVVGAGVWQAVVSQGDRFTLFGCVVAPGFDYADFDLPSKDRLRMMFPQHAELIDRYTQT